MELLDDLLGLSTDRLNWYQMSLRSVVVFIVASLCVFIAGMRAFRKRSPIDLVAALILGAILSRAIIGSEPFFPILAASFVFVMMHKLSEKLIYMYRLRIKNRTYPVALMQEGKMLEDAMADHKITKEDLKEAARQVGAINDLSEVSCIYLESDGKISIIPCR